MFWFQYSLSRIWNVLLGINCVNFHLLCLNFICCHFTICIMAEGLEYTFLCKVFKNVLGLIWLEDKQRGFSFSAENLRFYLCGWALSIVFFLSVIMVMFLHCIPISIVYCPVIFTHLRRDITVRYLGLSNYDLAGRGRWLEEIKKTNKKKTMLGRPHWLTDWLTDGGLCKGVKTLFILVVGFHFSILLYLLLFLSVCRSENAVKPLKKSNSWRYCVHVFWCFKSI